MQFDREHGGLAFEFFRLIIFGESDVDIFLLADIHAHDLLFESFDEGMAAENERVALRRAAFEFDAVHAARKIDDHAVAVFRRAALYVHRAGISFL